MYTMTPACHVCKRRITSWVISWSLCSRMFILHWIFYTFHFVSQRAKVDEIPEATEDYSKEFSKLNYKTESDKVHRMSNSILHKMCRWMDAMVHDAFALYSFMFRCTVHVYIFSVLKMAFLYRFNFIKASVDLLKGSPSADINKLTWMYFCCVTYIYYENVPSN